MSDPPVTYSEARFIGGDIYGRQREDRDNDSAVIFVHGFRGDPEASWKGSQASFPELIVGDGDLSDYDVFQFGYYTKLAGGQSLEDAARSLRDAVRNELDGYRVVFVAHSMGGLVCMRYVLDELRVGNRPPVIGIMMFGTPVRGVELLRVARDVLDLPILQLVPALSIPLAGLGSILNRKQIKELAAASEFLQDLHSGWILRVVNGGHPDFKGSRSFVPVEIVTGTKDRVVSRPSARGLTGSSDWHTVETDHRGLVKPADRRSKSYSLAKKFLQQCRESIPPDSLDKLARQGERIWSLRRDPVIRDWHYEVRFPLRCPARLPSALRKADLVGLEIERCEFEVALDTTRFRLAFALGEGASKQVWEDHNPLYVHHITTEDLSDAEQQRLGRVLGSAIASPDGWEQLMHGARVDVQIGDSGWTALEPGNVVQKKSYLLREMSLDPEFVKHVGRLVRVRVSFSSVRPRSLKFFRVRFPWMTDGCNIRLTFDGAASKVTVTPSVRGYSELKSSISRSGHPRTVGISSSDLVLPETLFDVRW